MKLKSLFLLILLTIVFIFPSYSFANSFNAMENINVTQSFEDARYEKAIIISVDDKEEPDEYGNIAQNIKVKLLSGNDKGKFINVINYMSTYLNTNLDLKVNQKVLISIDKDMDGNDVYSVSDYLRTDYIYILMGVFILILLFVGRKKGLLTIVSLIITLVIIFFVSIPLIIKGHSPILIAVISSFIISFISLLIVGGFNLKTISAILGTSFGAILAGVIAFLVGTKIHLTGLSLDETQMLLYLPDDLVLDPGELLFAGIIWGSIGAVMDVGMSVSSSIQEISRANESFGFKELFKSGMNVGRDIMATMSNTLILAYMGSALPLILLVIIYQENNFKILNLDVIATEIVRSLSGSIGLILSIPITALIAAFLIEKNSNK
ncbi:YibE/F family protein [Peptoniphilus sp. oral taxon 386]|uniref:YibE/F family protein n=1 Tax=Peptoniphilus sp. oral taxon 386 TaxID=652713 RepID=UPI0001DA9B18|nr:YibE/F family protein [Peptoniphilus sp. oral taxon 386]EFI42098.1 YibE/F-like protein [Peptoniphilus sp. oral taxon 386 str. F0131]